MNPCLFACLYRPHAGATDADAGVLAAIAQEFSPRFQVHRPDLVVVDVAGLERLLGPATAIASELRGAVAARGIRAHVAVAGSQIAAAILAHARPGLTVVAAGGEAEALAPIAIGVLERVQGGLVSELLLQTLARWGIRTLGELAALPASDLVSRFGREAIAIQAAACGRDLRPLVPTLEAERFDAALELEWPIEGLEPLSFVLTRLLEPLSTRLERRDRGAAVLHVLLRLVSREIHARRLELPTPMRDVRALRTLALLDLESHPPGAAIDCVTIVIDPTPGRVLQHGLFTRAHPTPERIATLIARLGALMGQDRVGAPATVDTYRPGAFAMRPFATEVVNSQSEAGSLKSSDDPARSNGLRAALRRCRQPVPARVVVGGSGRPIRVTTDRRGFTGGAVAHCAGPWRTSGNWWRSDSQQTDSHQSEVGTSRFTRHTSESSLWDRDEWDVALGDGAVYRVFRDRTTDGWFIDAVID